MSESTTSRQPAPDKGAQFPRGRDLPSQSPLFWVEQKDRYLRQLLIRDIEAETGRRLVVYFSNRYIPGSDIQPRDIAYLAELIGDVKGQPADMLLETNGGQTDATEALISTLQSTISDLRVIVTNAAKSNGTLLALAARSVVMGATSELGPIEPALGDVPCSILDTPEIAKTNFPLHMMGKFALQQSRTLAARLLEAGMMAGRAKSEIEGTVEALAGRNRFPSHGSVVDHREALGLGLKIEYLPPDNALWQRLWLLYSMYDFDSRKGRLLKVFEGRARSLSIAAPPAAT